MAKAATLLVDGEPFDPDKPTQAMLDIQRFLDGAPKNEVFSVDKLQELSGRKEAAVRRFSRNPAFSAYHCQYGIKRNLHFGHPEAIKLLKATVRKKQAERGK